jgi:HK97 gp10 family phage protein
MNKVTLDTSGIKRIQRNLNGNKRKAIADVVAEIVAKARENAPVLSGALRDSIHAEDGQVVADSDHALFVELGTSKMAAQPFLSPAVKEVQKGLAGFFVDVATGG